MDLCVRKTNPTVILQRNSWQIRQGLKYFMRDVTFGANSSVYTPAIPEDTETMTNDVRDHLSVIID